MNKRQVLDIVLIIFGIYFLMYFIQSMIATTWQIFFMPQDQFVQKGVYIFMMWLYLLIPLALSALFLFRREKILNMLIGKTEQQEVLPADSVPCYGRVAFWIQIIGLYYLISSGIRAIVQLTVIIVIQNPQYSIERFLWKDMANPVVTLIVAALLIRKSESIANFINTITK